MKIRFSFLSAVLLLGCGDDQPLATLDATLYDADASETSVEDTAVDALPDAGVSTDTNPLHDMDSH